MSVAENLKRLKEEIGEKASLIAVSKTKPNEMIQEAYEQGHLDFGENKAREMQQKAEELPKDIRWHFIGHLQRNKVKYIIDNVHLIHSVDSLRLLEEINKRAKAADRKVKVLLQVYIAKEESKFGLDEDEVIALLHSDELKAMQHVEVVGLMGMATNTNNQETIKREFISLKSLYDSLKDQHNFSVLSMGMSNDYSIALECGSNMLRVGSLIFGSRKTEDV